MQGHYHSLTPNPTTRASPPATMTFRKRIFSLFSCLCHGKRGNRGNVEMKGRENHFFRFTSLLREFTELKAVAFMFTTTSTHLAQTGDSGSVCGTYRAT